MVLIPLVCSKLLIFISAGHELVKSMGIINEEVTSFPIVANEHYGNWDPPRILKNDSSVFGALKGVTEAELDEYEKYINSEEFDINIRSMKNAKK